MEKKGLKRLVSFLLLLSVLSHACVSRYSGGEERVMSISSPDGDLKVYFQLKNGIPFYNISKGGVALINYSRLGFKAEKLPSFDQNFILSGYKASTFNSDLAEKQQEPDHASGNHSSMVLQLKADAQAGRNLNIEFEVYNDGVRFRYEIPAQNELDELQVVEEMTEFSIANNYDVWWLPVYSENLIPNRPFKKNKVGELSEAVQVPLIMVYGDSLFLSIHEDAASSSYAEMALINNGNNTLKCNLVGKPGGLDSITKVRFATPLRTPWRTILVTEKPENLFTSILMPSQGELEKIRCVFRSKNLNK